MTITEQAWLTGDNLPAKVRHLHDIGDVDALRAFVVECRVASGMSYTDATAEPIYDRSAIWFARGDWICDWSGDNPQPDPRLAILRDVAGNPFRLVEVWKRGPAKYRADYGDEKKCKCGHTFYRHFDSYEDMEPVGCKYCQCERFMVHERWATDPTATSIASSLRENPHDVGAWAALHDSLAEAGCDNEDILNHCRGKGRCFSCLGDGYLDYPEEGQEPLTICLNCNGTGWTPLPKIGNGQHTANCWVLRLLTEKVTT